MELSQVFAQDAKALHSDRLDSSRLFCGLVENVPFLGRCIILGVDDNEKKCG